MVQQVVQHVVQQIRNKSK